MSSSDYRRQAWEILRNNWGYAIAACLIASVVTALVSTASAGILSIVITGPVSCGLAAFFATLFREKRAKLEAIITPTKRQPGDVIVAGVLYNVFVFLWALLFVIPGIVKSYAYSMTFYILNDNPGMTATDAIKESQRMMQGHKLELFLLHLSFIGWFLLCGLTFGILTLFVLPYLEAANFAFYENLKKNPQIIN